MTGTAPVPVARTHARRLDIQGLRAVAVLAVLGDHLWDWPHGGFGGVDVFFVISGFLITGLLLAEIRRTGSISLATFYLRRVRRLLPAAVLVLAVTLVMAAALLFRGSLPSIAVDVVAAATFVANWRFAATQTNYFAATSEASPVQHYWSLSVEEQYYLVWPGLLLLLLMMARSSNAKRSVVTLVAGALVVLGGASLVWAWRAGIRAPEPAYFSTFTRAWELAAGGLLACALSWWRAVLPWMKEVTLWLGLTLIAASLLVVGPDLTFPFPGAVGPVLGSLLVVLAGVGHEPRTAWLLRNRVMVWIGEISYSLYLWHMPVFVFLTALLPAHWVVRLMATIISLGLAAVTYYVVERPLQQSPWPRSLAGGRSWSSWRSVHAPTVRLWAMLGLAGLVCSTAAVVMLQGYVGRDAGGADPHQLPRPALSKGGPAATIAAEVKAATGVASWPNLSPDLVSAVDDQPEAMEAGCLQPAQLPPRGCTYGEGPETALLIGDSYAVASAPMLAEALRGRSAVVVAGFYSCAVSTAPLEWPSQPAFERDCAESKEKLKDLPDRVGADHVYVLDSEVAYSGIGVGDASRETAWKAGRRAALEVLTGAGVPVTIITANPLGADLRSCATALSSPAECESPVTEAWLDKYELDVEVASSLGIPVVNTLSLFADEGRIPVFAGGIVQRTDNGHLTDSYARHVGPALQELLDDVSTSQKGTS